MSCNPISFDEENKLLGVILCGGRSVRMGSDKGLMKEGELTWVEQAMKRLQAICSSVVVSVNETQVEDYRKLLQEKMLVVDSVQIPGPLCGLLSVHDVYPSHDLLVMACDLPDIKNETLVLLKNIYEEKAGEHGFMVFSNQEELEPMLGVYTSEGLSKVFKLFIGGQLPRYSMKHVLETGNTFVSALKEKQWNEFRNYNLPEDLKK